MTHQESPPRVAADGPERAGSTPATRQVQFFVVYDVDHDQDLYELLSAQSDVPGSGFVVMNGSERPVETEVYRERVRGRICEADQVVVICGEYADASPHIHAELLIAQDENKPYILIWGRRGVMCTKPIGAKPAEGIYGWTRQVLYDQMYLNLRRAGTDAMARSLGKATRNARALPPSAAAEK